MGGASYFDASALVKLLAIEPERDQLRAFVAGAARPVCSIVGRVEIERAVRRRSDGDIARLAGQLEDITWLRFDSALAVAAAVVPPALLRTVDAIHLASAAELGSDLEAFVTYDRRLADAARSLGMHVVSPGA